MRSTSQLVLPLGMSKIIKNQASLILPQGGNVTVPNEYEGTSRNPETTS